MSVLRSIIIPKSLSNAIPYILLAVVFFKALEKSNDLSAYLSFRRGILRMQKVKNDAAKTSSPIGERREKSVLTHIRTYSCVLCVHTIILLDHFRHSNMTAKSNCQRASS